MIADKLRNIFGGVRLGLTLFVLIPLLIFVITDLVINGFSERIYAALGAALVQVVAFTASEAKRKTGDGKTS